jgi:hypothetical protein
VLEAFHTGVNGFDDPTGSYNLSILWQMADSESRTADGDARTSVLGGRQLPMMGWPDWELKNLQERNWSSTLRE